MCHAVNMFPPMGFFLIFVVAHSVGVCRWMKTGKENQCQSYASKNFKIKGNQTSAHWVSALQVGLQTQSQRPSSSSSSSRSVRTSASWILGPHLADKDGSIRDSGWDAQEPERPRGNRHQAWDSALTQQDSSPQLWVLKDDLCAERCTSS